MKTDAQLKKDVEAELEWDPSINAADVGVIGAGATHAWLHIYLPGAGWVPFDPTNALLGGSSLINGMLYLRGHQQDYDRWQALGNPGWSWADVLPYFQRAMNTDRAHPGDGQQGPLWVSEVPHDPLSDAFVAAAGQCGVKPGKPL